jgi:plasmid maintenance system killer protein
VEIHVKDKRLRAALEDETLCRRRHGMEMTKKLMLRVASLRAAETLADFWPPFSGPERCHELKGDMAGTFSIDLKQPYRLLFEATDVKESTAHENMDQRERWQSITSVEILTIEDTHG